MPTQLGEIVLNTAHAYGDDIALKARRGESVQRFTFAEVGQYAQQLAVWLADRGMVKGSRVAVWAPNMPEYAVLYFGCWLAGCVVVPIDVRSRPEVVQRFVEAADVRLGFKSQQVEGCFGAPVTETHDLEDLVPLIAPVTIRPLTVSIGPTDLCEIAFTSGTTGAPKGVMLTHDNLMAELAGLQQAFPLKRSYRTLSVLPLSHSLEQVINLLLAFSSGVPLTYVPRLSPRSLMQAMREDRITCFIAVPELLRLMLAGIEGQARRQGAWWRWRLAHRLAGRLPFWARRLLFRDVHRALGGRLRFLGSGGAPLDLKLALTWERMGVTILEGYGLTETTAAATINNWEHRRLGSVGMPIPGVEVRIDSSGEVLIRGRTVTPGYLHNPDLTARMIVDGWLHTGDIGFVDDDGYLHISGRDAFKIVLSDGHNVYPEDIEQALNCHPLVRESCVVGVEGADGAMVHAVLLTDTPAQARRAVREVNRTLAAYQQISGFTIWPEEDFPRTATLKVNRKLVHDAVRVTPDATVSTVAT